MHDQLLNHEVARLHRAEFLRESGQRHRVDRQPGERKLVAQGLLDRLSSLAHRHRRPKAALLTRSV
ncbi:MAG: hypothetical protein H0T20_04535 [Actinobacteria bacterium]|nr:hypothetical protein [Actinomycetota bacterium]